MKCQQLLCLFSQQFEFFPWAETNTVLLAEFVYADIYCMLKQHKSPISLAAFLRQFKVFYEIWFSRWLILKYYWNCKCINVGSRLENITMVAVRNYHMLILHFCSQLKQFLWQLAIQSHNWFVYHFELLLSLKMIFLHNQLRDQSLFKLKRGWRRKRFWRKQISRPHPDSIHFFWVSPSIIWKNSGPLFKHNTKIWLIFIKEDPPYVVMVRLSEIK